MIHREALPEVRAPPSASFNNVQAYEDRRVPVSESDGDMSEGGPQHHNEHPKIKSDHTLNLTHISK